MNNAVKVFHRKNILVVFAVLFLIPFLNLGVASSYVSSISIPEFIMEFIAGNKTLLILFLLFLAGLGILLLRWLYAFHYFTLEGCNFKEARKKSAALSRKKKGTDLAALLGLQFLCYILYFILVFSGVLLAVFLSGLFSKLKLFGIVSASVVWVFLAVSLLVVSALGTPISYACISMLFYSHKEKRQEEIIHRQAQPFKENKKRKRWRHIAEGALFVISVACCSFYLYSVYNHKVSIQIEYARTMEVTAHRGASRNYPENTMAAFEGARELGADWIELDVQQSQDGQIFVMHDTNFKRTAGVDRDNIEMKPTGHEQNFEKKVAEVIDEAEFWEDCVITSQVYEVLERAKACDKRIQTVYVMSLAYGDINRLTAADHFSIEATSISEKMVSDVHNAGKQLYAWTVNTEENINRMIDLQVDNIITDDVTLAKECIYLSKTSNIITEYVKWSSVFEE